MRASVVMLLLCLGGCALPQRQKDAEASGYERGYRQAVKEQYWIIQNQQRNPQPTSR